MSYKQLYLLPFFRTNRDIAKEIYGYLYADIIVHRGKSKEYRDFIESSVYPQYRLFSTYFTDTLEGKNLDNIPIKLLGFKEYKMVLKSFIYYKGEVYRDIGGILHEDKYEGHLYHAYSKNSEICYWSVYTFTNKGTGDRTRNWWIEEIKCNAEAKHNNDMCEKFIISCKPEINPEDSIYLYEKIMGLFKKNSINDNYEQDF